VDDLVRVALVSTETDAELAVSRLRLEGIPAMWQDAWLPPPGGGIRALAGPIVALGPSIAILVHPQDAERAHELLNH
jgi:hypothetical protein